jgi:hypothetical protein
MTSMVTRVHRKLLMILKMLSSPLLHHESNRERQRTPNAISSVNINPYRHSAHPDILSQPHCPDMLTCPISCRPIRHKIIAVTRSSENMSPSTRTDSMCHTTRTPHIPLPTTLRRNRIRPPLRPLPPRIMQQDPILMIEPLITNINPVQRHDSNCAACTDTLFAARPPAVRMSTPARGQPARL